jgi:hypothetical protein
MVPIVGGQRMQAVKGRSMEKWFCWSAIGVGGLMILLFALSLFPPYIPFGAGISIFVKIVIILASGVVVYLGWNALRELP